MKNTKKILMNMFVLVFMFAMAFTIVVMPTLAAADSDFTNATASGTALITDYKTPMITYIITLATASFVIALSVVAILKAKKWLIGAFAGHRRRR